MNQNSRDKLGTCHPDLQKIFFALDFDGVEFEVLEGERGEHDQNLAYTTGKSKVKYPDGKHNKTPSLAVDVYPKPLDWKNRAAFAALALRVKAKANHLGIKIKWGGDFKNFSDMPHYELA